MDDLHTRWYEAARFSGRYAFGPLLEALGGRQAFEQASSSELVAAGAPANLVGALLRAEGSIRASFHSACIGDSLYPARLLDLPKPPPVIWWIGKLQECLAVEGLAVVGARSCTDSGRRMAGRLGSLEAASGGVVISGAARGIDRAAHEGAQEFGRTLAVLGAGLNASVTRSQRKTREAIVESGGAIVSEFPPEQSPSRWTFPQRNRLVAALSRAVVVVEAGRRSGALITAGFARDLGRDVYAIPGPLWSPVSVGCHELISEGARIVVRLTDPVWERSLHNQSALPPVLRLLRSGPLSQSEIEDRTCLSPAELRRRIGTYEIAGLVQRLPGARIALA